MADADSLHILGGQVVLAKWRSASLNPQPYLDPKSR